MVNQEPVRAEADRLASLTPDEIRREAILQALRLGQQSRAAGEQLAEMDRQVLAGLVGEDPSDEQAPAEKLASGQGPPPAA